MITSLTGKNQITLPAKLVKELRLRPGARIEWSTTEDGAMIGRRMPSRAELATKMAGRGRKYLRPGSDVIRELIEDRVREDEQEA